MTGIPDLTHCHYLSSSGNLFAVGWLDRNLEFPKGSTPSPVFDRLVIFFQNPFMPVASSGYHSCNLCQFTANAPTGSRYLLVPSDKLLYAAPELVLHYIAAHWYRPPDVFCDAVMECPPMQSSEYREALKMGGAARMFRPD